VRIRRRSCRAHLHEARCGHPDMVCDHGRLKTGPRPPNRALQPHMNHVQIAASNRLRNALVLLGVPPRTPTVARDVYLSHVRPLCAARTAVKVLSVWICGPCSWWARVHCTARASCMDRLACGRCLCLRGASGVGCRLWQQQYACMCAPVEGGSGHPTVAPKCCLDSR